MEYLVLGFITGLSLILAIGAQNIFVIEQGLKKQYVFLVCLICSISDLILIFSGILLFHYFHQYFNIFVELTLNICLIIFLIYFIYSKIKSFSVSANFNIEKKEIGKGIAAHSSYDAKLIIGKRTEEISNIIGFSGRNEMIHRDDLIIFVTV